MEIAELDGSLDAGKRCGADAASLLVAQVTLIKMEIDRWTHALKRSPFLLSLVFLTSCANSLNTFLKNTLLADTADYDETIIRRHLPVFIIENHNEKYNRVPQGDPFFFSCLSTSLTVQKTVSRLSILKVTG